MWGIEKVKGPVLGTWFRVEGRDEVEQFKAKARKVD